MIKVFNVISDTNIGGAGKCLLTYLEYADRSKFDLTVVLPEGSLLKPHLKKLCIKLIEIDAMSDKSLDRQAIKKLTTIFKKEKPDIVHSHASMSARIAARRAHAKIVYTRHSVFPPSPRISHGIGKTINGLINNHYADGIIAVAEAAKQNLLDTGVDGAKIRVILNGVKPLRALDEAKKTEARKAFGVRPGETVISIVARLNPVKGHEYFLRAAKKVLDRGVKARFIIAGTGEALGRLRQLSLELGIDDNLCFAGFVEDVTPLMNITDIQVNASYGTEATSLSLLEGMSLGIPAVVSDFGGNPGVITDGENGLITPQKDADALADALIRLCGDEACRTRMQEGAKKIFESKFRAEVMSRNIEAFYTEILQTGGNKR